jgi:hypothetical protein
MTNQTVVYHISEHGGYWRLADFPSRNALIIGALARGFTYVGRTAEGWPVFGPGIAITWQGKPDTLYGPQVVTADDGTVHVSYRDTGAAYLARWPGLPAEFHASDL